MPDDNVMEKVLNSLNLLNGLQNLFDNPFTGNTTTDLTEFSSKYSTNEGLSAFTKFASSLISDLGKAIEDSKKKNATVNETECMAEDAEEYGKEYILENYDKDSIQENDSDIYQLVSEKIYEYLSDRIHKEYDFSENGWDMMYDALADVVYEKVNLNNVWQAIDVIIERNG